MEHKFLEPIELTDAELDVVSGGHFVGVKQVNVAKQSGRIEISSGPGAVNVTTSSVFNSFFTQSQTNNNTGTVTNSGSVTGT
jgi:hypothetical protein